MVQFAVSATSARRWRNASTVFHKVFNSFCAFPRGSEFMSDKTIIPFIEGDGTGPDIWRASVRVFDAAVAKAFALSGIPQATGARRVGLLVMLAARQPDFQLQYPFFVGSSAAEQWAWEIAYGSQFFALEYFFRGFVLRGLAAEMGASAVKPGDAVFVRADVRFSHDYTTAMAQGLSQQDTASVCEVLGRMAGLRVLKRAR